MPGVSKSVGSVPVPGIYGHRCGELLLNMPAVRGLAARAPLEHMFDDDDQLETRAPRSVCLPAGHADLSSCARTSTTRSRAALIRTPIAGTGARPRWEPGFTDARTLVQIPRRGPGLILEEAGTALRTAAG